MADSEELKELVEAEWKGMPEFEMEDLTSKRKLILHFRSEDDVEKFATLIGQDITAKQASLWYPYMPPRTIADKHYVDSGEV